MAESILPAHPINNLPLHSDLALVLELEDPLFLMSAQRLEELIAEMPPGEARAYLYGVLDTRLTFAACIGTPA